MPWYDGTWHSNFWMNEVGCSFKTRGGLKSWESNKNTHTEQTDRTHGPDREHNGYLKPIMEVWGRDRECSPQIIATTLESPSNQIHMWVALGLRKQLGSWPCSTSKSGKMRLSAITVIMFRSPKILFEHIKQRVIRSGTTGQSLAEKSASIFACNMS